MLTLPDSSPIELKLAGHTFRFRRLSWREEVQFSQKHPDATRRDYAAAAMATVDGLPITYDQAKAVLLELPRPICDRVIIFYMGSLPGRRQFQVDLPYRAPEASAYTRQVGAEDEELMSAEEEQLNRTFGAEEVAEAQALAREMVKGTKAAGVSRSILNDDTRELPHVPPSGEGGVEEEAPRYHMVVE